MHRILALMIDLTKNKAHQHLNVIAVTADIFPLVFRPGSWPPAT